MRGYSLIECICSLCIVGLLTASIAHLVHRSSSTLGAISTTLEQRFTMTKAGIVLSAALAAHERMHLPDVVTITNGSAPNTRHGGLHPVAALKGNTRPRTNSAILSIVEVAPRFRGRITKSSFSDQSINIDVCDSSAIPGPNTFRSHVAIGLAGLCQLTGTPERTYGGCFTLTGKAVQGLLSSECAINSLLEYIPVSREFSVYVDATGELRLISHVGQRIIENQPIVRGLRSIDINALSVSSKGLIYRLDLNATATRSHRFYWAAGLTMGSLWNEVLL
jgi:hypothetical protein